MSGPNPSLPKDQLHIAGFTAFIGLLIVFLSSMEVIRRNSFPVFYISHITGVVLFIGAGFAHQYAVIVFISPPLLFYIIDRVTRTIRSWGVKTHSVEVTLPNQQDVTKIVFTKGHSPRKVHPGQFVFLSVNDGTLASKLGNFFDWHPFTISEVLSSGPTESAGDQKVEPSEGTSNVDLENSLAKRVTQPHRTEPLRASVHMKQLGRFTNRIHSQVMKNDKTLHVHVDGPYGSSTLALERHNVVVFFEAGIGITPSLTMLRDLAEKCNTDPLSVQTTAIYFIWVTANMSKCLLMFLNVMIAEFLLIPLNSVDNVNVFLPQLMKSFKIATSAIAPPHIECDIYISQSSVQTTDTSLFENLQFRSGRPAIQDILSAIDTKHAESTIALQTCGPTSFMRQAANAANKKGWAVRRETFEF
jgi:ferredoxin-NADP reductase